MTALEKAARDLAKEDSPERDWDNLGQWKKETYLRYARIILMSVRDPSLETITEGIKAWPFEEVAPTTAATRMFTAMVDAILKEEVK